jgi:arginine decarboxylase
MLKNRYKDLINQTFYFPRHGFEEKNNELHYMGMRLMDFAEQFHSPLKFSYLPKISTQVQKAKKLFSLAIEKYKYKGSYTYCYCTKSSHFKFVMDEVLKNDVHIETSSACDIDIIKSLYSEGKISKNTWLIHNGFKDAPYLDDIAGLANEGFPNVVCVLDNKQELGQLEEKISQPVYIGLRIAITEDPNFALYTSRLGIRYDDILPFYNEKIKNDPKVKLKMLHFFINTGIKDTSYYWSELARQVEKYCELKTICPELDSLDIGGGLPIYNTLGVEIDYEYMIDQIVYTIKTICDDRNIPVPNIFTEFGSFTVGESGGALYSVVGTKQQNDTELWYMIDSSFINTLPDTWGIGQKFILLALNHWDKPYVRVNLGGITCDGMDYYNSEAQANEVFMPKIKPGEKLYLGFFHTGAYQESIGGYGGLQHCLLPAPKHIVIDDSHKAKLFAREQSNEVMLKILGYNS